MSKLRTGTAMPDDLYLMAIVAGGMSRDYLYGAVSEVAYLRAESSQPALLEDWYLSYLKQRMMWRVEAAISSISDVFDEHMRQLFEQNHMAYTLLPPMMDLIRAARATIPSRSSSNAPVAESEARTPEVLVRSSSTPPIDAPGPSTVVPNLVMMPSLSSREVRPEDVIYFCFIIQMLYILCFIYEF